YMRCPESSNFDFFCGKGRGEFEKFLAAPTLSPLLSTGFLPITDKNAVFLNFFREIYETKIILVPMNEYIIPKIVHQIWIGPKPLPEETKEYQKSFHKYLPGWEYKLWTEKEIEQLELINKDLYLKTINPGEKSDIGRLELLYQFGGVYLDADCEWLKALDVLP